MTETSGMFLQDPAPGQDPVSFTTSSRLQYNATASKKKFVVPGEGTVEKRMLCITPRTTPTGTGGAQKCCVTKALKPEDNINDATFAKAEARLKMF